MSEALIENATSLIDSVKNAVGSAVGLSSAPVGADNSSSDEEKDTKEISEQASEGIESGEAITVAQQLEAQAESKVDGSTDSSKDEVDEVGEPGEQSSASPIPPKIEADVKEDESEDSNGTAVIVPTDETDAPVSVIDSHLAAPSSSSARAPSPLSRTSTPPLGPGSAAGPKKFSSVNVNKKFLSKTGSPAPTSGVKITSLNGRPAASPIPISSPSSRLLSTKLVTVPKTSSSPNPPGASASAASSPWAKPSLPPPDPTASVITSGPPQTKARILTSTALPMGIGQGIGTGLSATKPAWRAVAADGSARGPVGLSRDFPTTKELAEGKRQENLAAQAQAAHNQAILQGLNAFTQLDPNAHRWEDDDDDDAVMDFGDGYTYQPHEHPLQTVSFENTEPVAHSERFVEDFDRSWPRRMPAPLEGSRRSDGERVLFNASANRLEAPVQRPPPPLQPTRLMSRSDVNADPPKIFDRPLPPHLQPGLDTGRMLPPHMTAPPPPPPPIQTAAPIRNPPPMSAGGRTPWGIQREGERQPPPHLAELNRNPAANIDHTRSPVQPVASLPSRSSFSQTDRPAPSLPTQASKSPSAPLQPLGADEQTVEMHTAAEKARLRRLAEEQDREAAAERARQKAKELEARLGLKSASDAKPVEGPVSRPPNKSTTSSDTPTFTLAQRPKPPAALAEGPTMASTSRPAALGVAGLPARPVPDMHPGENLWRSKQGDQALHTAPSAELSQSPAAASTSRPTAESFFESTTNTRLSGDQEAASGAVPLGHVLPDADRAEPPKRESQFDNMLARIQAAMTASRTTEDLSQAEQSETSSATLLPPAETSASSRPTQQPISGPSTSTSAPRPPKILIPQFFDVTQPPVPKSPPPVWRTHTIRLPKASSSSLPAIAQWRLQAFNAPRQPPPSGWLTSFTPPLDPQNSATFSLADILLSKPLASRFANSNPVVNIPPRTFELFKKKSKPKKNAYEGLKPIEVVVPPVLAESLLPSASTTASATLQAQRVLPNTERWKVESASEIAQRPPSPVPAASVPTASAEKQNGFPAPTVPEQSRGRDARPGVRFMVSSELEGEGENLLDEVNRMSLETVGEGGKEDAEGGTSGAETPKTPPSLSGTSSRNHPPSPSGNTTPWSARGSARSSSQHDAIRSAWDQASSTSPPAAAFPTISASFPSHNTTNFPQPAAASSSQPKDAPTPLYPSLNAPSSTDPPAPQPLPAKYPQQAFSSPGSSINPFGMRQQSPHYGYTSPDQQSMVGLSYASLGGRSSANGNSANVNGWGSISSQQQGVWSPSAFGASMTTPGYGYSAKPTEPQSKSGAAFNGKDGVYSPVYGSPAYQQHSLSPTYPGSAQAYRPQATFGLASPQQAGYGYAYGAPGQGARPTGANGGHGYEQQQHTRPQSGASGGYYGGVGGNSTGYSAYTGHAPGTVGQQGRGGGQMGRKMW